MTATATDIHFTTDLDALDDQIGDTGVMAILTEQGYKPTLGPNVWSSDTDDGEAK